jgi:cell division protein FtsA
LVDIGASTAEIILYEEGLLRHTAAIPVGGDHFTNDLAVGLRTPIPEAERLKCTWGLPVSGRPPFEALEVSGVGERPSRMVPYVTLAEILEPRATELLEMIHSEIARQGIDGQLGAGVVLTGGGAKLKGLTEMAERILPLPVRCGIPGGLAKMGEGLLDPTYSAVVGLVGYAHRMRRKQMVRQETLGRKLLGLFRARA